MTREDNSYTRALAQFEALITAPATQIVANPSALGKSAGLANTTGHRLAFQAEAQGVLQREPTGTYRRGPILLRAGLSALGFGRFAYTVEPLIVDLRRAAGLTAFLYVLRPAELLIGPYSVGRSSDFVRPRTHYALVPSGHGNTPSPGVFEIVGMEIPSDRRQRLLLRHGAECGENFCGLGLMLPHHLEAAGEVAHRALSLAVDRLSNAG